MNWVVVGQGAIGSLWHFHLQQYFKTQENDEVTFYQSTEKASINAQYTFIDKNNRVFKVTAKSSQQDQLKHTDVVLVCVKSYQISQVIAEISPFLPDNTAIILCHNGMGTFETLPPAIISCHSIFALLTTHGCLRNNENQMVHTGLGKSDLGLLTDKQPVNIAQISHVLNNALPQTTLQQNIIEKQWQKLAINCVINPLTAIHQIKNGALIEQQFEQVIGKLIDEICQVATMSNVILNNVNLAKTILTVANATAENQSSMLCDVLANRPTEIDYINGYIVQAGQQHCIDISENLALYNAVKALEN